MLPLTEMLGPSGPLVATRQGAPSSQAERIKSRTFWLIGMGGAVSCGCGAEDNRIGNLGMASERISCPDNGMTPLFQVAPSGGLLRSVGRHVRSIAFALLQGLER